jgi:hypothetical protein
MAIAGILLLLVFFRPPTKRPGETPVAAAAPH